MKCLAVTLLVMFSTACLIVNPSDLSPPIKVVSVTELPKRCRVEFVDGNGDFLTKDSEGMCNLTVGQTLEVQQK